MRAVGCRAASCCAGRSRLRRGGPWNYWLSCVVRCYTFVELLLWAVLLRVNAYARFPVAVLELLRIGLLSYLRPSSATYSGKPSM